MMYKAILLLLLWSMCFTQTTRHTTANGISKRYIEMNSQDTPSLSRQYIITHHDTPQEIDRVVVSTDKMSFSSSSQKLERFASFEWSVRYQKQNKTLKLQISQELSKNHWKIKVLYLAFSNQMSALFETSIFIENLTVDLQHQNMVAQIKASSQQNFIQKQTDELDYQVLVFYNGFSIKGPLTQSKVGLDIRLMEEKLGFLSIYFQGSFDKLTYQISLLIMSNENKVIQSVRLQLQDSLDDYHNHQLLLEQETCQWSENDNCWGISYLANSASQLNEIASSQTSESGLMSQSRMMLVGGKRKRKCSGKSCTCVSKPNAATCVFDRKCKKCNIKTCVPGYYLAKSVCIICPPALTNCQTCGPNLNKKTAVICYVCLPGFVLSSGVCVPCPAHCSACTSVVVSSVITLSCTACVASYVLQPSGAISICSVPVGSFFDTGTSTVVPCNPLCLTCDTATTCTSCPTGTYLDALFTCTACQPICQTCIAAGACQTCPTPNFIMDPTGICVCPPDLLYDISTNDCLACDVIQPGCTTCDYASPINYLLSLQPVVCLAIPATGVLLTAGISVLCPDLCDVCTSATTCSTCISLDYAVEGGLCQCAAGLFYNVISNTCIPCGDIVPGCTVCSDTTIPTQSQCTGCNPIGFFLVDSTTCQSCPQTCLSCTSATVCTGCVPILNMIPINGGAQCVCDNILPNSFYYNQATDTCDTCDNVILNCQICELSGTTVQCNTCNPQYFKSADSLLCQPCLAQCSSCLTPTACTGCDSGYDFVPATGLCICGSSCEACQTATSDPNCVACTPLPTITCTQCATGFFFNSVSCVSCTFYGSKCEQCSNTACTFCQSPFTFDGTSCVCDHSQGLYLTLDLLGCDICSLIILNCESCSNTSATTTCSTCELKAFYDGTNCIQCDIQCATCNSLPGNCLTCAISYIEGPTPGTCICDSLNGYFYDAATEGCSLCSDLIQHCLQCSSSTVCTKPEPQYYFYMGECLPCPETCKNCNSQTSCTSCPINLVLGSAIGLALPAAEQCVCNDPFQTNLFVNPETLYCSICSNIFPGCTNCIPNTNNFDIICDVCAPPTYIDNGQCAVCPNTCTSCTSDTVCTGCIDGNIPVDGQCLCDNLCKQCLLLVPGCLDCTVVGVSATCNSCVTGMFADGGVCYSCPSTCDACTSATTCTLCKPTYVMQGTECVCQNYLNVYPNPLGQCTICSDIFQGCTDCTFTTGETACQACRAGYFLSSGTCQPCDISCITCSGPSTNNCLTCLDGYILSGGVCSCPAGYPCETCQLALAGCLECIYNINGIVDRCRTCGPGLYPVANQCLDCDSSCLTCDSDGVCLTCKPTYQIINDVCACNPDKQMWDNGASCQYCGLVYSNCISCQPAPVAMTFGCKQCRVGSYVQNYVCVLSVCGDGVITSGQECDDGNVLASDGCGPACQQEINFACSGQPSFCQLTIDYGVTLSQIKFVENVCNLIQISFILQPVFANYQTVNFEDFLGTLSIEELIYSKSTYSAGIVTYTFQYTTDIQDEQISIFFLPDNLGIPETLNLPAVPVYLTLKADNNVPLVHYSKEDCTTRDSVETVAKALEYSSYAVMALSMAPAKIVGLQLFGVLQLGHLSVGNLDEVNMMMSPLLKMKGVQGFSLSLGEQSTKKRLLASSYSPERVQAIGYESNFLRNCNIMLAVVGFAIVLSLILFLLSYCIKRCAKGLHNFSKRLIKQVLLTLILFNCFNFAYSAGIHFTYAPEDDSLYQLGTLAAVMALVLPLIMAFALVFASDEGFGEFKEKFKPGKLQRMYFFVTILYRTGIGLYISTMNSDSKSTLIVLALSIAFLLYNLVNLPYTKAYHNYRANVCHFTQFISLFVVMYYRTMLNNESVQDSATMYTPAYIELTCICISLIVSLIVLVYEIYLFFKQCCSKKEKPQKIETEEKMQVNNSSLFITEDKEKQHVKVMAVESIEQYYQNS